MQKLLSIVLPIFNEAENIDLIYQELTHVLKQLNEYGYELIFVDDGSSDASWQHIVTLADQDDHVKGIRLSRNFGHQVALSAGYDIASGDAVISMDADLQDPPTLVPHMIQQWREGADIVYARRINRRDTLLKRITAYWFYNLLNYVAEVRMPRHVGDFRLIDKKVLLQLRACKERFRYLRGLVAWTGFTHAFVDFDRPDRKAGSSGYTWAKMCRLAADGLTSFSMFPLKLAAYIGWLVILSAHVLLGYLFIKTFFYAEHYSLTAWLAALIYLLVGVQFFLLWILGEYVGRIYDQQKDRPLYIINQTVNYKS